MSRRFWSHFVGGLMRYGTRSSQGGPPGLGGEYRSSWTISSESGFVNAFLIPFLRGHQCVVFAQDCFVDACNR